MYDLGTELKVGVSVAGRVLWMESCAGEGFFSELFLRFSRGIHSANFLTLQL